MLLLVLCPRNFPSVTGKEQMFGIAIQSAVVNRWRWRQEWSRAHVVFICAYGANTEWATIDFQPPASTLYASMCCADLYNLDIFKDNNGVFMVGPGASSQNPKSEIISTVTKGRLTTDPRNFKEVANSKDHCRSVVGIINFLCVCPYYVSIKARITVRFYIHHSHFS